MEPTPMRTDRQAYYLDGRTAARQRATVRLMLGGLQVHTENGLTLSSGHIGRSAKPRVPMRASRCT